MDTHLGRYQREQLQRRGNGEQYPQQPVSWRFSRKSQPGQQRQGFGNVRRLRNDKGYGCESVDA